MDRLRHAFRSFAHGNCSCGIGILQGDASVLYSGAQHLRYHAANIANGGMGIVDRLRENPGLRYSAPDTEQDKDATIARLQAQLAYLQNENDKLKKTNGNY